MNKIILSVVLVTAVIGYSQSVMITGKPHTERWYEDNNMGVAGGVPPDFASRYNETEKWSSSLAAMDVYSLRSSVYKTQLKTNSAQKIIMGTVFQKNHIAISIDDASATWAHYTSNYSTPDYTSSINMIQDLKNSGWNIQYIGLQSVLSKPLPDGGSYGMDWRIKDVLEYYKQIGEKFPELRIGIIDALPAQKKDYRSPYYDLKTALSTAGYTLSFIDQDWPIDYFLTGKNTFQEMIDAEQYVRDTLQCSPGLFHSSARGGKTSNELYRSDVINGLNEYLAAGGNPSHIVLSSWHPYPAYSIPDTINAEENPNGATMLGTFCLMNEIISNYGR